MAVVTDGTDDDPTEGIASALSRSLYRRLRMPIADACEVAERQRILDACEMTMHRLVTEPHFAKPARFLFEEIRASYPLDEQLWVRRTVEAHIAIARQIVARMPARRRECAAFTRAGTPCQREPVPDSEYCPSHKHLDLIEPAAET
jgi:hypothetical protein